MKLSTKLELGLGLAVGYVFGTAAGRDRYQQIKATVNDLVRHPKVQQVAFDLADRAKSSSSRLPGPAATLVNTAATRLEDRLTHPADVNAPVTDEGADEAAPQPTPQTVPPLP